MGQEEKTAYSQDELKEFEVIILQKLSIAKEELHLSLIHISEPTRPY